MQKACFMVEFGRSCSSNPRKAGPEKNQCEILRIYLSFTSTVNYQRDRWSL